MLICGINKRDYPRTNFPHNLHAAVLPRPGAADTFVFENWRLEARNGLFLPLPAEVELPMVTIFLPAILLTG